MTILFEHLSLDDIDHYDIDYQLEVGVVDGDLPDPLRVRLVDRATGVSVSMTPAQALKTAEAFRAMALRIDNLIRGTVAEGGDGG